MNDPIDQAQSDATATTTIEAFVRSLPKAELHLHIEGSLEPELLFELAERNGVDIGYADVAAVRDAYQFTDLQSFLDIYYAGAAVLQAEQDFHDLALAYFRRAHADGVRRCEIFFDPQTHTDRGIGFEIFMPGLLSAAAAAEEMGISVGLIMCFLRHLSPQAAIDTFRAAAPWHDKLLGVGLDSSERDHPPEDFVEVFALAAEHGLRRVAHAGEEGPPAYIWSALDTLEVDRIDHGVRCDEDPDLVARLVDDQTPLTVCPLSNLALCVVDRLEDHNLARLLRAGVKVTVNSDDPSYFGGYVVDNYVATAEALALSRDELVTLARNSLEASFAPAADIARWCEELEAVVSA